jgi:serine/threonine protein kinase
LNTAVKRQPIPFGKYLLLDRINIGGMAEVWRGKTFGAGGFERLVAIKRILPNIAEDEEFISMFIDEAKITVQLNHANIAQIYELSHIAASYFIAMEYIPGKDMRAIFDRCRKKGEPAPIPLTCYVIGKSCEGLDYAHRKQVNGKDLNIVHRDVSPQNVLISYEGEVKVIDFGIAKAAGKATKTQAGILKGKFGYMSPEQIRGLPLDRRSDVFALGVCLYEMLTGERLFVGDSDFSVLEKVRKVEVLPPSTYNRKIPEGLEKIVMKALAKDVDDRYQYASEVADDLQRFLITSESIFSRKDLAQYMKSTFAEEVDRERQRIIEYTDIKPPEGMLAAAEMGFGGPMPQLGTPLGPAVSQSAVTSIPSAAPSIPRLMPVGAGTGQTYNPRPSAPPMLSPQTAQHMPPPPPSTDRSDRGLPALTRPMPPSAGAIPRLTAAAPMLTNGKEDNSTQLVDGETLFNPGSPGPIPEENPENATVAMDSPFSRGMSPDASPATDPMRQAVQRAGGDPQELTPATPIAAIDPVPDATLPPSMPPGGLGALAKVTVIEPPRGNPATRPGRRPSQPVVTPPPAYDEAVEPSTEAIPQATLGVQPQPVRKRRSPGGTGMSANNLPVVQPGIRPKPLQPMVPAAAPSSSSKLLIIAMAAIIVLLGGGLAGVFFLKPEPKGLLYVEVPDKAEVLEITVNGDAVKGWTADSFPFLTKVPVGKASVLIKVKGYQPLLETVTVNDDNTPVHLSQQFKKSP